MVLHSALDPRTKKFWFAFLSVLFLLSSPGLPSERSQRDRILAVVQRMEAVFRSLADYTCDVNQIYYRNGEEDQIYRFKFFLKKEKKIRVDFSQPHPGMTMIYKEGEDKATIIPLRSSPKIRFRFPVDSYLIKTPTGQRIDQTDIGYLLGFLSKNLQRVRQEEAQIQEDDEKVSFFIRALDYIEEKTLEKYRISVNKKIWLPNQIERYRLDGIPIEVTHILNYSVNSRLEDKIFNP